MRVCTFMCVHTLANPKVKRVLDTNIMTRFGNWLLIPSNINPNPILVIRPYVNGICPDSSTKAIHSRRNTTHTLTPMFLLLKLQPYDPYMLGPGLC